MTIQNFTGFQIGKPFNFAILINPPSFVEFGSKSIVNLPALNPTICLQYFGLRKIILKQNHTILFYFRNIKTYYIKGETTNHLIFTLNNEHRSVRRSIRNNL